MLLIARCSVRIAGVNCSAGTRTGEKLRAAALVRSLTFYARQVGELRLALCLLTPLPVSGAALWAMYYQRLWWHRSAPQIRYKDYVAFYPAHIHFNATSCCILHVWLVLSIASGGCFWVDGGVSRTQPAELQRKLFGACLEFSNIVATVIS
jgi:hypothetical protein